MRNFFFTVILLPFLSANPLHAGVAKDVDVKRVQTSLTKLCLNPGPIDGLWGRKTEKAAKQFLKSQNKTFSGTFTKDHENTLWGVLNSREIQASFGTGSVTLCKVNQPRKVTSKKIGSNKVTIFEGRSQIPDLDKQVNDATISHYYRVGDKFLSYKNETYKIRPLKAPVQFKKNIETSDTVDHELSNSAIFSYLYYDDGVIVYDALPPKGRFTVKLTDRSYFQSHSMGKSITSYILGHAICQGYISSINEEIYDWELMEDTLYFGQPLINLLTMTAGDSHVIDRGIFVNTGRNFHGNAPLKKAVENPKELKGSKRNSRRSYKYSNLTTDVIFNYIMHRTGSDFEKFIKEIYQDKIRIEHPVILAMNPIEGYSRDRQPSMKTRIRQGAGVYGISATRYDYLRIAKAILDDWNNDTCVGKYLKEIHAKRVPTNFRNARWDSTDRRWGKVDFWNLSKSYAGQFYTDIKGLRNKTVLVMNGANGQQIAIDTDDNRIVVINAAMEKFYDTYKLGYEPIKYGRIR